MNHDDGISVISTPGEDSPRRESEPRDEEETAAPREPEVLDGGKDESIGLEAEQLLRRSYPQDRPADISPHSERTADEVGGMVDQPDAWTMREYEKRAREDREQVGKAG